MPHKGRSDPLPHVRRERARVPGSPGQLHGHGSAPRPLLHQLLTQHLPVGKAVRWQEFCGDVSAGPVGWLQVRGSLFLLICF